MTIQELRIGNWVLKNPPNDYRKVEQINTDGWVWLSAAVGPTEIKDVLPVPLTPELLEKIGFEKDESDEENTWWRLKFGRFTFETDSSVEGKKVYVITFGKEIDYVTTLHQLQNLFYILTGNELTINL